MTRPYLLLIRQGLVLSLIGGDGTLPGDDPRFAESIVPALEAMSGIQLASCNLPIIQIQMDPDFDGRHRFEAQVITLISLLAGWEGVYPAIFELVDQNGQEPTQPMVYVFRGEQHLTLVVHPTLTRQLGTYDDWSGLAATMPGVTGALVCNDTVRIWLSGERHSRGTEADVLEFLRQKAGLAPDFAVHMLQITPFD